MFSGGNRRCFQGVLIEGVSSIIFQGVTASVCKGASSGCF